jgi:hypothetical protein
MVKPFTGVDLGIWKASPAALSCPLDVHSKRSSKLGLQQENKNDKSINRIGLKILAVRTFDPVKYDCFIWARCFEGFKN